MSAEAQVRKFILKVNTIIREVGEGARDEVFRSIVEGSPITGAPGQPVDTGYLRASWSITKLEPLLWEISTRTIYAPGIEDGSRAGRAMVLRSQEGGFHSVKVTRLGWQQIVDKVSAEVAARH